MLETVVNLFTRRDPRREASVALTRIISRYDMQRLSFEEGIAEERRCREERSVALSVWLFPINDSASTEKYAIDRGVPAVSHNVRAEGFGIMTPVRLESELI